MYLSIINSFYDILTKKFSGIELLLNISFILIIGIIIYIFYWHNINRQISKLNRCKIALRSDGGIYNLYGLYDNTKIYRVRYDNSTKHNVSVDCSCPKGNIPNKFNMPVYNGEEKRTDKINKYCMCDKNYDTDNSKINFKGDGFLIDYHNKHNKFYINPSNNNQPEFPRSS